MPLRVAAAFMPLCVAGYFARNRSFYSFMPLRVAGYFARNRSDRFPAPSCGQALRPAPGMSVGGSLRLVGHASAAINR
jgi:hypothetical protein